MNAYYPDVSEFETQLTARNREQRHHEVLPLTLRELLRTSTASDLLVASITGASRESIAKAQRAAVDLARGVADMAYPQEKA